MRRRKEQNEEEKDSMGARYLAALRGELLMLRARARHRLRGARPGRSSAAEQEQADRERQKAAVAAAMSAGPRARKRRRNQATRGGGGSAAGTGIAGGDQGRAELRDGRSWARFDVTGTGASGNSWSGANDAPDTGCGCSLWFPELLFPSQFGLGRHRAIPCTLVFSEGGSLMEWLAICILVPSVTVNDRFYSKKPSVQSGSRKQTKIHRQCACWVLMACPF